MAMPQVHIVAYCGDLGYGVARGAEMLSLMLAFGIISRVGSGFIADRIGGVATLLIGSVAAGLRADALSCCSTGSTSLYVISALFGLFQGGIVPSYAIIVREYFSPKEAGTRRRHRHHGDGVRHGGSGAGCRARSSILPAPTGRLSPTASAWNLINTAIALWLLLRPGRRRLAPA